MYHAIPGRQHRLRRIYSGFVGAGDLVFDIGAHAGNHVRCFASLGCRVVALEPQPDFAKLLRTLFASGSDVVILEVAAGAAKGRASLAISERTPTVTSIAPDWQEARAKESGFARVRWNRKVQIETTTLDDLIARFGVPAFVKIDVEGSEPAVLAGLSRPVRALSFEYLPKALERVEACIARLTTLGPYVFNWSAGETYQFGDEGWLKSRELLARLRTPDARRRSGDVYARLPPGA